MRACGLAHMPLQGEGEFAATIVADRLTHENPRKVQLRSG